MKRLLLLLAFAFCLTVPFHSHAQRGRRQAPLSMGMTVGFKLGGSFSGLSGSDTKTQVLGSNTIAYDTRLGAVAGGLANYRFTPLLSIQGEVLYAGRGFIQKLGYLNGNRRELTAVLHYVDVPVLLKVNAKIFYLEVGPVASYLVAGQTKGKKITGGTTTEDKGDVEGLKSIDVGGGIGGGVELTQGGFFGVRYVTGFSSIGTGNAFAGALENYTIQVTGGYIFNHSSRRGRRH